LAFPLTDTINVFDAFLQRNNETLSKTNSSQIAFLQQKASKVEGYS